MMMYQSHMKKSPMFETSSSSSGRCKTSQMLLSLLLCIVEIKKLNSQLALNQQRTAPPLPMPPPTALRMVTVMPTVPTATASQALHRQLPQATHPPIAPALPQVSSMKSSRGWRREPDEPTAASNITVPKTLPPPLFSSVHTRRHSSERSLKHLHPTRSMASV